MTAITFLIWSNKHEAWWKPDGWGYTTDMAEAGRFSADAARDIVTNSAMSGKLSQVSCMVAAPENWAVAA